MKFQDECDLRHYAIKKGAIYQMEVRHNYGTIGDCLFSVHYFNKNNEEITYFVSGMGFDIADFTIFNPPRKWGKYQFEKLSNKKYLKGEPVMEDKKLTGIYISEKILQITDEEFNLDIVEVQTKENLGNNVYLINNRYTVTIEE